MVLRRSVESATQSGHSCLGPFGREVCPLSARADIYFALCVPPLRRAAQSADQLLKGIGVFRGVLEPSQEVEWLSKFPGCDADV
jgi:hypothetical protein